MMPTSDTPLTPYAVGRYGDLRHKPNPDGLIFHFVPSLTDELALARNAKGADLTVEETTALVRCASVMLLPPEEAEAVARKRGFKDVDPENLWPQD